MLEVHKLDASYGEAEVLKDINIKVEKREAVAIIGPNGAGKTTLLRALSGILRDIHGEIVFNGQRIDGKPPYEIARLGLVYTLDRGGVAPSLTVTENLEMGGYCIKEKQEFRRNLDLVFELFPKLKERRQQLAGTLSGGERQMLNLGKSLMTSPKVLMIDEISLGLAPIIKQEIYREIEHMRDIGITVLLTEQDTVSAFKIAHRVYLLENGRIGLEGKSEELIDNPHIKEAYLGI